MDSNHGNIEKKLIISILKLTKKGSIPIQIVRKESKISSALTSSLLNKLNKDDLIGLHNKGIIVNQINRIKLAIHAMKLGGDLERVTNFLDWKEFEKITAIAFERNRYRVKKNVRFKQAKRRWEIDIIGFKKPTVICVDCKHWHHGLYPSTIKKIVKDQVERTRALTEYMPHSSKDFGCLQWKTVKFIPAILSLTKPRFKFYKKVPIIPILQIQDFINQLPAYSESLKNFTIKR